MGWDRRGRNGRRVRGALGAVLLAAGLLSLSGCAALLLVAPTGDVAASGSGTGIGSTDGSGSSGPVVAYSDGSTNRHGYIPKRVGEPAGVLNAGGTAHLLSFTVSLVRDVSGDCQGTPPGGLHPVEVDLNGLLAPEAASDPDVSSVSFDAGRWRYFAPGSDVPVPLTSGNPICWKDDPSFQVTAGTSFFVAPELLVPAETGSIAFALPDGTGWEWDLASSLS